MTDRDSGKDLETRQLDLRSRAIANRLRQDLADGFRGVIAISGRAGSGKRPLAHALATDLGFPHASFGAYVRAVAAERGLSATRRDLQDLGDQLISEFGWDGFCRRVLEHAGVVPGQGPVVIDGVRHEEILDALVQMFSPERVYMIYLHTGDRQRRSRLRKEDDVSLIEFRRVDSHPTERDAKEILREEANDVVLGNTPGLARRDALRSIDRLVHFKGRAVSPARHRSETLVCATSRKSL